MDKNWKGWHKEMTDEESKNLAYWERNMLALLICNIKDKDSIVNCGWYYDIENNWDGWKRVLSISNGLITFHIPDDFNTGSLKEISPNWDGHNNEQKWTRIMQFCGITKERK